MSMMFNSKLLTAYPKPACFRRPLLVFTFLINLTAFGQNEIVGEFIRTDYPAGYIILNADKSFKFRFGFDSQWDLACGQFEVKGDTITFSYTADMFSVACNSEGINMTDTSDYFLKQGVDRRWRPITARVVKNKILTIKTGDQNEAETLSFNAFYYKRKKKGANIRIPGTYIQRY
ncbi:MAG: hypothetical protein HYZ44_00720 [Bacteroidetes bacterium]|nr:hypothetical protein [Bacteroidota bacterium]